MILVKKKAAKCRLLLFVKSEQYIPEMHESMKVVIAPNALKDSLSQSQAVNAIANGIRLVIPDVQTVSVPVSDGGDGLIEVMQGPLGGRMIELEVTGPLFQPVKASYLFVEDSMTAIFEMARSSGLALLKLEDRNAMEATTFGLGELVRDALKKGAKHLVIGIGGSATNDGGTGFAAALGAKFLDSSNNPVKPIGRELSKIASIQLQEMSSLLSGITVEAVCDVEAPLCGPLGAAAVFGPQKGATPEEVKLLDAGLAHLAEIIKSTLGMDVANRSGSGAAGGLGAGLAAFSAATLRPGVEVILDLVGMNAALEGADLVFTAEGKLDYQTIFGKGPAGVAKRAKKQGIPCIAIAGGIDHSGAGIASLFDIGVSAAFSLCSGPMSLDDALQNAAFLMTNAATQATRAFLAGQQRGKK